MSKKILLVEDDLDLQKMYLEKLKMNNYEVVIASNSSTALQFALDEKPNLIILDIMIPGKMNGMDVLSALKKNKNTSNIAVLVLTNLDGEKKEAMALGASDYLVKAETSLNLLLEKVKNLT
jgi:two-component system, OmpR family, phosphate regulon response regulator PhoB